MVGEFGLSDKKLSPTVPFSVISPWALEDARMDLNLLRKEKRRERGKGEVNQYVEENDSDYVKIYYDTFKNSGKQSKDSIYNSRMKYNVKLKD